MTDALSIADEIACVEIRADLGAGVARYDLVDGTALFRAAPRDTPAPFALGCNLLVPWSNRIAGSFSFGGEIYALAPNLPNEPFPLHGNGFQLPWRVREHSACRIALELDADGPAPFRYTAHVVYELRNGALTVTLSITNAASIELPYGLGLHPWFPRTPGTTLQATAREVWLEDAPPPRRPGADRRASRLELCPAAQAA